MLHMTVVYSDMHTCEQLLNLHVSLGSLLCFYVP